MSLVKLAKKRYFCVTFLVTLVLFLLIYIIWDPINLKQTFPESEKDFFLETSTIPECVIEPEDDSWFTKRFNKSIHPLMTRENSVLTDATFAWWQKLQRQSKPAEFRSVVEKLFSIIPDVVLYKDTSPERCRSCAVVGNSGNLKGSKYGKIIDYNDFVIRMNNSPTKGFEEDVGSRTTHRTLYPESAVDLDNDTSLVLIPFKTLDLQWMVSALTTGTIRQTYRPVRAHIKANKDKVLIYSPAFFKYVYDSWLEGRGGYPSTGFLTLFFALHICDEVNVFGFGTDQNGNWHHYWENNLKGGFRLTGLHSGSYEYHVIKRLASMQKIQMFRGRRCPGKTIK
ncbi:uncharacterized protein V6R79_026317 [Siganus canaliculatus]